MQTQIEINTHGIEVIELEMEEIDIKGIDAYQEQPEELTVQNQVAQYRYLPDSQMVA